MLIIKPSPQCEVTRIPCPYCGERLPRVGLQKDSKVKGLTFKCRKCGKLWGVETE